MEITQPVGDELRRTLESKFIQVLQLAPGFKSSSTPGKWAALLYAAIEPEIGLTMLPSTQDNTFCGPVADAPKDSVQVTRLKAVVEFCRYMICQVDPEERPNDFALEQWVSGWDKANNGDSARNLPHTEVE